MVGDIRWSSCTVGWRGLWGSLGADTVICCVAYGGLLSGHVLPSGRYIRRAALERRQGLHQVSCGGIAAQRFEESLHANRPF